MTYGSGSKAVSDHRWRGLEFLQLPEYVQAVPARHFDVEQDEIGPVLDHGGYCLRSVAGRHHAHSAGGPQNHLHRAPG